uniref:hypothetical protein n=1 Tax=Cuminum cyminum TaxID=52462 RepID=UPI0023F19557|nr:hypothetical protein P4C39_mgp03 [Cuminum cyminum]WDV16671.1 hypothetical protein [Cuminum cyminum]
MNYKERRSKEMHGFNRTIALSSQSLSDASGSASEIPLQGIPVVDPGILSWAYKNPNFFPSSVWIPGEISDPNTISALSQLNKFLIVQRHDFFNGPIQADYIHLLQREVSAVSSPELLAAKLNYMLSREYTSWYTYAKNSGMCVPKHDWYVENFGSLVPSPIEPLYCEPYSVILIIMIAILSIIILWRNNRRKSTESFGTSMSTHHILGLKKVPRVRLFAPIQVVRELGDNRSFFI